MEGCERQEHRQDGGSLRGVSVHGEAVLPSCLKCCPCVAESFPCTLGEPPKSFRDTLGEPPESPRPSVMVCESNFSNQARLTRGPYFFHLPNKTP